MQELEVVRIDDDATLEQTFMRGLRECYAGYGVDVAARSLGDAQRHDVRLVVLRGERGALLGGARVHPVRGRSGFPAERVLAGFPAWHRVFAALAREDAVELAAMWTTSTARRTGIARLLAQASIACAMALGKRVALTFSHQHFEPVLATIGMRAVPGVAPIGFPDPRYRSRVYAAELPTLVDATAADRGIIREMAGRLGAGSSTLTIERVTAIEQGAPSFAIAATRTTRAAS